MPSGKDYYERGDRVQIEAVRKQKGISRRELAIASGVTENSIYRYERNKRVPNANVVAKIASAMGVKIDDLFTGREKEKRRERMKRTSSQK